MQCPRCRRGLLWNEDGRLVCSLCAHVADEGVSLLERLHSNQANEQVSVPGRDPALERLPGDIAAAVERAMAWRGR